MNSKILTISNSNIGRFQLAVTSWSKPNKVGPVAASKYPTDWDIPDKEAASVACIIAEIKATQ